MGTFVPATEQEKNEMLSVIGCKTVDDLFHSIPDEVKVKGGLNLPAGLSELEVRKEMTGLAAKNKVFPSIFRGAGAYRHYIPAIVKSVVAKEKFLTAYTPYQAETSQGVLQAIFEYQTMICELTGMDASNACVYDGASAAAEAVAMCKDRKRTKALISAAAPQYVIDTIKTYCFGNGMEINLISEREGITDLSELEAKLDEQTACVYIQHPNFYGSLEDAKKVGELAHEKGAKYIMGVNPISLGVMKTPKEYGADVAVGEGQPLGLSLSFGGPYLGFMACVAEMTRKLPGRIVGETVDIEGKTGYVLTLQAREQHIRREKASSNICSNQALCALAVSVYLAAMGKEGVREAALQSMSKAHYMAQKLSEIGYETVQKGAYFYEFVTSSKAPVEKVMQTLEQADILGGLPLAEDHAGQILWCCTEMNSKEDIDQVIRILKEV